MEFEQMSESYREKHFPKGSVFERSAEKNKNSSIMLIVMLVLLAAALAAGGYFFLDLAFYHRQAGHSGEFTVAIVAAVIFFLLILLCVLGIVKLAKGARQGADAAVRRSAKASGLTEEEVREFDRQAMQSDCRILKLTGAVSAALANQSDGLLTREYLWLGDIQNCVMKLERMTGACLYQWTYYAGKKRVRCLSVAVVDRDNRMISAEADSQRGRALLTLLKTVQPALQVTETVVREGKEFDDWRKSAVSGS